MTTVDVFASGSSVAGERLEFSPTAGSGNLDACTPPPGMPIVVPASQLYFWSRAWQEEERAAERARQTGEVQSFESATDMIRWLLTPED